MLHNPLIFGIGGVLAAAYFYGPAFFASSTRPTGVMFVAPLYLAAMAVTFLLADAKTAFVVLELGVAFTVLSKLMVINFHMVHSPNYPKHRRCY